MKKMANCIHFLLAISLIFAQALLSGCSFLPTEEEPLAAPVLSPYERRTYTTVAVRRDDLVQTKTISCRCRPVREESYSFSVGGLYIENVYFAVGDPILAGDMIAELERKDVLTQVEEAKIAVKKQEYALGLAKEDIGLRRERLRIQSELGASGGAVMLAESPDELRGAAAKTMAEFDAAKLDECVARYAKAFNEYLFGVSYEEKRLEIAERKLATLLEMAEERVIYATIDGVISYAQRFTAESRSVAGERAFTISDASELVFVVSGDDALYFAPGEIYQMKVSKSLLDMRAVSPEEFGETPSEDNPVVYFVPVDLTAGLASYGYIVVEVNRRDGALYLPASAIIQVGDGYAVYRIGESGFRELSPVEKGVTISGKTEILSGLVEGDEVIID